MESKPRKEAASARDQDGDNDILENNTFEEGDIFVAEILRSTFEDDESFPLAPQGFVKVLDCNVPFVKKSVVVCKLSNMSGHVTTDRLKRFAVKHKKTFKRNENVCIGNFIRMKVENAIEICQVVGFRRMGAGNKDNLSVRHCPLRKPDGSKTDNIGVLICVYKPNKDDKKLRPVYFPSFPISLTDFDSHVSYEEFMLLV